MPIEFQCPTCQARIRTPDDAAGKSARCPQCGGVSIVPGTPAAYAAGPPPEKPPVNPFADQPFAASAMNPYAPPSGLGGQAWPPQMLPGQVRARLMGPAIGLLVFAIAGLGFMALLGIFLGVNPEEAFKDVGPDPAEKAGAIGFFAAYFTVGLVTRLIQLLGAIAMMRQRSYALAMAGAICAIIPCEIYCCLPCLPLGIWALVVLSNSQVKAAFG